MAERYWTVEDFFKNSKPCSISKDVTRQIAEEYNRPIPTSEQYKNSGVMGEEWSYLSKKVVGSE